jgi:antitoxin ParD1/3/4
MATMNVFLPDELKAFVDQQVAGRGYSASSELIRHDREREVLRALVLEGVASGPATPLESGFFDGLRERARRPKAG